MRLRCSLRWVAGMLQRKKASHEAIPLLLNPYTPEGRLSFTVVLTISNPVLYMTVLSIILPGERDCDFSTLVHTLARHGVYLLDDNGGAVDHSMLSQTKPFHESSHVAVLEGLMFLYSHSIVTLPHIVSTVRGISKLVASKDLPTGLCEGLLLWLNKVSESVLKSRRQMVGPPGSAQKQRYSRGELHIPVIDNLCVGVCDGQCLGALLVYYAPDCFKWTDFHFGRHPLTEEQVSENLSKVIDFLSTHINAPGFHLTKKMLLESHDSLHSNLEVLVAHIYYELQVKGIAARTPHHIAAEPSAGKTKLLSRFNQVLCASSDNILSKQRTHSTVFTAPVRDSVIQKNPNLRSKSSHELITADTLPIKTHSQPQTSLVRARTLEPRASQPWESWCEEKPEQASQKSTQDFVDTSESENVRASFTVDTNQTLPSAIAAGLPVVESPHGSDKPEGHRLSSPESPSRVIELEMNFENFHSISPSPLVAKLLTVYEKIKERRTALEQEEGASRERIAQKVNEIIRERLPPASKKAVSKKGSKAVSLSEFPFSPITPLESTNHMISENNQQANHQTQEASHTTSDALPKANGLGRQLSVMFAQTQQQTNPWNQNPLPATAQDELLRQKREQQVRERLEEREKVRRVNQEKRRKAVATRRVLKELNDPGVAVEHRDTTTHMHYQLSDAPPSPSLSDKPAEFLSHNGPGLYVPPRGKSNKKLIKNALSYVCLAGDVNLTVKQRALAVLESSSANHILVLFRDIIGFKFRGLYSYSPDSSQVSRIFGSGPKVITSTMVAHLYKYNSGRKEFREIHSRTFSVSIDAFTIQSEHWTKKSKHR